MSKNRNYVFTTNNYTSTPPFHSAMRYLVFGKEVGESGTPHLQGYVVFNTQVSFKSCQKYLETGSHIEVAKGNHNQAITYCKKDGDFEEFGEIPQQGKRSDLERLKDAIKDGERNPKRLRDEHMAACKFPHVMNQMLIDYRPTPECPDILLKPWQVEITALVRVRCLPGDRTVTFVVDPEGGGGKSTFCAYIESVYGDVVQVMKPGKYQDMAFELDDTIHILLMDTPRSRSDVLQYHFLEDVKDGRVSCSKYQSYQKRLQPVHVVVMCNEAPDMSKLSQDRFKIIYI